MEALDIVRGTGVAILKADIDTDQIIPVPEMTRSTDESHERWGAGLFAYWRYVDIDKRIPNPDFILNQEPWEHAKFLLAGPNFGCGSSREPAPKALRGFGFRVIVAPSFSGIFFNNCFRNGLLPIELGMEHIRPIAEQLAQSGGKAMLEVDLVKEQIVAPNGQVLTFRTPPVLRMMLLRGLDEIDLTLQHQTVIEKFRDSDARKRPWSYSPGLAN